MKTSRCLIAEFVGSERGEKLDSIQLPFGYKYISDFSQHQRCITRTTTENFYTMDALPLEIREHISLYLLPPVDQKAITSTHAYSRAERANVYSLRLVNRRMNLGTLHSFVRAIEDVPTQDNDRSLRCLASLIALPDVRKNITSLAFSACKLYISKHTPQDEYVQEITELAIWLGRVFQEELVNILRQTPRLRHLTCLLGACARPDDSSFEFRSNVISSLVDMTDPFKVTLPYSL
jgi:hypothetical protein